MVGYDITPSFIVVVVTSNTPLALRRRIWCHKIRKKSIRLIGTEHETNSV
jgi:hypothetical protein